MLFTNYKQIAELHLHSKDCTEKIKHTETLNKNEGENQRVNLDFVDVYKFPVNILNKMSPTVKIVLKSFCMSNTVLINNEGTYLDAWNYTKRLPTDIYIKNINNPHIYSTDSSQKNKLVLLHEIFCRRVDETYVNQGMTGHIIQNTNLQNTFLEIVIDTNIPNEADNYIKGCPEDSEWVMVLEIYDTEMEENPKLYSNAVLPIMPPKY